MISIFKYRSGAVNRMYTLYYRLLFISYSRETKENKIDKKGNYYFLFYLFFIYIFLLKIYGCIAVCVGTEVEVNQMWAELPIQRTQRIDQTMKPIKNDSYLSYYSKNTYRKRVKPRAKGSL